ncbi:phage portal protein [Amycolatopsis thermoflava]|uniref:phage portal protein n=1 Tax=Amycolatopsis thermoflava TaxID=84480 RepID=UPI003F4A58AF
MGLGKMLRPRPAPREHMRYAGSGFELIIDGTPGGVSGLSEIQTYRGAMSIPGAWRAATLISDLIGKLPWNAYDEDPNDGHLEKVQPTPPLLEQPAPPDTRMTTFSSWALDLVWHGNAVGVIAARDEYGYPDAVLPVPASWVGVRRVSGMDYSPLPVGAIEYWIGGLSFAEHEVLHIKGPCAPGALRGFGVLEAHLRDTLSLAAEQRRQAHAISQHGVPTAVLKSDNPDLTEPEAQQLKAGWLKAQRDRTVAVLNATTSFEALGWDPEKLELVEARKYTNLELANIFGLPPRFLGASTGGSLTYNTSESETIDLLKFSSFGGHLARFEQALSLAMRPGRTVTADLDALLRSDTLTRYKSHEIGVRNGWIRRSEVRRAENMPPVDGIDDQPLTTAPPAPADPAPKEDDR